MSGTAYLPRYGINDYLAWDGDWELWDGHPVSMSPSPGFRHQQLASQLHFELARALRENENCGDCHLLYTIDWHVDQSTVVRPDILILCGEPPTDFVKRPPAFIAEILSPSTAEKDRTYKRALYQSQGVPFYLLADPDAKTGELLRLDPTGVYHPSSDLTLALHESCQIDLELSALFLHSS